MKTDILYIWLQMALGICNRITLEVMSEFGSAEEIYNCRDFSFLGEGKEKYIKRLESKDTSDAFEVLKKCESIGAGVLGYYEKGFPSRLRGITAPPVCLYFIGKPRDLDNTPCIAVVGTRKLSDYGRRTAEYFAYQFSKSGAVVVSGLAKGIDVAAHRGAVRAGGYTVGVLGNPIGVIYPKENAAAFRTLYERGLVISEMYPGCPTTRADFPNRNRLISGMCDATVIAEAGEGSGSLITAKHAVAQGRKLYAIPGEVGARNAGTNELIKHGVSAATEPFDVISALQLEYPEGIEPYAPGLTEKLMSYGNKNGHAQDKPVPQENMPEEKRGERSDTSEKIENILSSGKSLTSDELAEKTGLGIGEVLSELTVMEIEGRVTLSAGNRYCIASRRGQK